MTKRILVLPGDGVGPEVTASSVAVINAVTDDNIDIEYGDIGITALEKTDNYLPAETVDLATDADAIIAGVIVERTNDKRYQNPIRVLKKQLSLYAVMRKFFPLCKELGVQNIDLILMTGNPDALLNITETENLDGVNTQKFQSESSVKKLFKKTMKIAEIKHRKKIACVHRASMFPGSDGMFLDHFYREMAASRFLMEDMEVDIAAMELVMDPSSMDVIVSTDLYGTVLAGVAAGMVGGSYLTPMGSLGENSGLFEPMHGPKLKLADSGIVNPTSAILSGAMALDHIGMIEESEKIRKAVYSVYAMGKVTPDVGGTSGTDEFTQFVIDAVRRQ
jgi:Isocitrate/isopropylmalate dehydrogenase